MNHLSEDKLHHSIEEFKDFINVHPKLIVEIRRSGSPFQEYYEKWILHGENATIWDAYRDDKKENKQNYSELFGHLMKYAENIDFKKVQKQVNQLNTTVETVQTMLNGFIESKSVSSNPKKETSLFNMFRD